MRQEKVWSPTDKAGSVVWHHDILDVDITTGEWLILARTNNIANRIATMLKEQGFLFWRDGGAGWSISSNVLNGIEVWLQLCKNQFVSLKDLRILQKILHPSVITKSGRRKLTNLFVGGASLYCRANRGFGYRRYTKPKVARRITYCCPWNLAQS